MADNTLNKSQNKAQVFIDDDLIEQLLGGRKSKAPAVSHATAASEPPGEPPVNGVETGISNAADDEATNQAVDEAVNKAADKAVDEALKPAPLHDQSGQHGHSGQQEEGQHAGQTVDQQDAQHGAQTIERMIPEAAPGIPGPERHQPAIEEAGVPQARPLSPAQEGAGSPSIRSDAPGWPAPQAPPDTAQAEPLTGESASIESAPSESASIESASVEVPHATPPGESRFEDATPSALRELAESVSAEPFSRSERRMGRTDRRKKRPSFAGIFAKAVSLASRGRLDEAIAEMESAGGVEDAAELHAGLGHLRFEQRNWAEAANHYAAVAELEPHHPSAHYNLGLCLERQGDFAEAARAFAAALAVSPERWRAQLGRGLCLLRSGPPAEALECLEAAAEKAACGYPPVHDSIADTMVFGKAVALLQLGRFDEAATLYQSLLPEHADAVDLLNNLAGVAAIRQDWGQAEELARKLMALQPRSTAGLRVLLASAVARRDYTAAVEYGSALLKTAAENAAVPGIGETAAFEPWFHEACFHLGVAQQALGNLEAARLYYEKAVQSPASRASAEANLNLGAILHQQGDLAGAQAAYIAVVREQPDMLGALWNLGLLAERRGDSGDALRWFTRVAAIRPDWEDVACRLGVLQFQVGDYAAAAASFETYLAAHPDWTDVKTNLAMCHWKLGRLDQAATGLRDVLGQDPEHKGALSCLAAMSLENILDHDTAEQAPHARAAVLDLYQKLELMGLASPQLSFNAGLLLQSAGEHAAALRCYQTAVEHKPDFGVALLNLGHAFHAVGDAPQARTAWARAVAAEPALAAGYFD